MMCNNVTNIYIFFKVYKNHIIFSTCVNVTTCFYTWFYYRGRVCLFVTLSLARGAKSLQPYQRTTQKGGA